MVIKLYIKKERDSLYFGAFFKVVYYIHEIRGIGFKTTETFKNIRLDIVP